MRDLNWLGLAVMLALTFVTITVIAFLRWPERLKTLVCLGIAMRVIGAVAYLYLMNTFYQGGDFTVYFARGSEYADRIWHDDLRMFTSPDEWAGGTWWGSQFVSFVSGIVQTAIGPTGLGTFVFFALLAFVGLLCFAIAFRRSFPEVPITRYLRWLCFFPSLWFWPSVIGKEPLILLGLGVSVVGYIGRRGRVNWLLLVAGMLLISAVRPQVAAVTVASMLIAQWLSIQGGWTIGKILQGLLVGAVCLLGLSFSLRNIGVDSPDVQGVSGYIEHRSDNPALGVQNVQAPEVGIRGVPFALTNILLRPFPWEARNLTSVFTGLELIFLWALFIIRRRDVKAALGRWRSSRLIGFALSFSLIYATSLGMAVVNLGIIARQRIFIFPLVFILLEAVPWRSLTVSEGESEQGSTLPVSSYEPVGA